MTGKNFYITTPIYYVNDVPHIGHAYTSISCDVVARFKKLQGYNVHFLTGTDEHGQKVQKSALDRGKTTQEYCDEISGKFRELTKILQLSNDDFIRTTEVRHKKCAQEFWQILEKNDWIYKDVYEGWYSIRDEAFYQENELINGKAPTGAEVVWQKEESYFFKLSAFQEILLKIYEVYPNFIQPESKRNEVISFVRGGRELEKGALRDLSVSRTSFDWGIKAPNNEKHVIYVWLDALTNYLSALDYPDGEKYKKFWIENNAGSPIGRMVGANYEIFRKQGSKKVHIVGKDILRFHCVYWPAFLLAAECKEVDLQKILSRFNNTKNLDVQDPSFIRLIEKHLPEVFAHGWWTNEGQKISKSVGNVIDPIKELEWLESFKHSGDKNVSREIAIDYFRYFLFREVPFGNDGDYSRTHLVNRINGELVNNIGNLLQRSASMLYKEGGEIVDFSKFVAGQNLLAQCQFSDNDYEISMNEFKFDAAISTILINASFANAFLEENAPWNLRKEGKIEEMKQVLSVALEVIRSAAIALQPFCINQSSEILNILNISKDQREIKYIAPEFQLQAGHKINQPEIVFPRLSVK